MTKSELAKFIINVSCIIWCNNRSEVLVMQRSMKEDKNAGKLGIPGGKVDMEDGSLEHALRREIFEETGAHVKELEFVESHSVDDKYYLIFSAEIDETLEDPDHWFVPSNECESVFWMTKIDLLLEKESKFTPHTYKLLINFLQNGW